MVEQFMLTAVEREFYKNIIAINVVPEVAKMKNKKGDQLFRPISHVDQVYSSISHARTHFKRQSRLHTQVKSNLNSPCTRRPC